MKKLLSLVIVFSIIAGILPVMVFSEKTITVENIGTYDYFNETPAQITGRMDTFDDGSKTTNVANMEGDDIFFDGNAYIIKGKTTTANATFQYGQEGTADNPVHTKLAEVKLNNSADIYIAVCHGWTAGTLGNTDLRSQWMKDEGYEKAYDSNGNVICFYNGNGGYYVAYKKSVYVPSSETKTIGLYSFGKKSTYAYSVIIKWRDNADITISKSGNGLIKFNGEDASNKISTLNNEEIKLSIIPDKKSYIKSITYGNEDFTSVVPTLENTDIKITAASGSSEFSVEFSDEYDFSDFDIKSEKYTDPQTSNIKQKIVLKGTTFEFLKGKTLKAEITDSLSQTQTVTGTVADDGSYELKADLTLSGTLGVSLNLYFDDTNYKEVATSQYEVETMDKINAFINNLRDIENYSDADFISDLKEDGENFEFDTEIFLLMSEENQTALVSKMKENYVFENLEQTVLLYNSYVPYYALSNTEDADLIIASLKKYEDFYEIKNENIYKRYDALIDKTSIISALYNKTYNNNQVLKDDLFKSVILNEFYLTSMHTDIEDIITNSDNRVYITPSNIATYDSFTLDTYKNAVTKKLMEEKETITSFDLLVSKLQTAITDAAQSIVILPPPPPPVIVGGGGGGGGGSVTVKGETEPTYAEETKSVFSDVPSDFWAKDAINYLVKMGTIETSDTKFYPDTYATRGDFVKYIIKAYKVETPDEAEEISFTDVAKDSELYSYIKNAKNAGIINGISETEFGINNSITRQDAAVILLRVLGLNENLNLSSEEELKFSDKDAISDYAKDAVLILSECKILNGFDNKFMPYSNITNAELAQLLYNALTNNDILESYYETLKNKEYTYEQITGMEDNEDYGYNQGGMKGEYTDAPVPHPVPNVININYNKEYLYMSDYPIIKDGRTLAPVRSLFNLFSAEILWDGSLNQATVIKDDTKIVLTVGDNKAYVNGDEMILDVPAEIINSRLYVPLRFIAERLNLLVEWNDEEQTVYLK